MEKTELLKLASAMRAGIELFPEQCHGQLWSMRKIDVYASCALGAVIGAMGLPVNQAEGVDRYEDDLNERFKIRRLFYCPEEDCEELEESEDIWFMIAHLNDDPHLWTREQIANWLEEIAEDE